ncbi:hypothetical protein KI387_022419, partial [Taxus chinensis]
MKNAIIGLTILALPYTFRGMRWSLGNFSLSTAAAVTFYSYFLMSTVLDNCKKHDRRCIHFKELASDILD